MADDLFTRCPGCKTIFRVTEPQLALRQGQVRCGHCRTVFNGRDEIIALDAPAMDDEDGNDELAAGPPTVTLRSAHALDPPPPPEPAATPAATPAASAAIADAGPVDVQDYDNRFARGGNKPPSRLWKAVGTIAIPLLVAVFLLQAIFHFRDALAAHFPATKTSLSRLCTVLGCSIRPLRTVDALSIEASDLQADPAHRGLLILSATIRNRAAHSISYPYLELTLTDSADQVVVRRALAPADYVSGTANTAAGIPANGEVPVKVFIDASATTQAGYRLYLFFP